MLVFIKRHGGLIIQGKETKRGGERQKERDEQPTSQTLRNAARKSLEIFLNLKLIDEGSTGEFK